MQCFDRDLIANMSASSQLPDLSSATSLRVFVRQCCVNSADLEYTSTEHCLFASVSKSCVSTAFLAVSIAFWGFKTWCEPIGPPIGYRCVTLPRLPSLRHSGSFMHVPFMNAPYKLEQMPFPCRKIKTTPRGCLTGRIKVLHYCHSSQR